MLRVAAPPTVKTPDKPNCWSEYSNAVLEPTECALARLVTAMRWLPAIAWSVAAAVNTAAAVVEGSLTAAVRWSKKLVVLSVARLFTEVSRLDSRVPAEE